MLNPLEEQKLAAEQSSQPNIQQRLEQQLSQAAPIPQPVQEPEPLTGAAPIEPTPVDTTVPSTEMPSEPVPTDATVPSTEMPSEPEAPLRDVADAQPQQSSVSVADTQPQQLTVDGKPATLQFMGEVENGVVYDENGKPSINLDYLDSVPPTYTLPATPTRPDISAEFDDILSRINEANSRGAVIAPPDVMDLAFPSRRFYPESYFNPAFQSTPPPESNDLSGAKKFSGDWWLRELVTGPDGTIGRPEGAIGANYTEFGPLYVANEGLLGNLIFNLKNIFPTVVSGTLDMLRAVDSRFLNHSGTSSVLRGGIPDDVELSPIDRLSLGITGVFTSTLDQQLGRLEESGVGALREDRFGRASGTINPNAWITRDEFENASLSNWEAAVGRRLDENAADYRRRVAALEGLGIENPIPEQVRLFGAISDTYTGAITGALIPKPITNSLRETFAFGSRNLVLSAKIIAGEAVDVIADPVTLIGFGIDNLGVKIMPSVARRFDAVARRAFGSTLGRAAQEAPVTFDDIARTLDNLPVPIDPQYYPSNYSIWDETPGYIPVPRNPEYVPEFPSDYSIWDDLPEPVVAGTVNRNAHVAPTPEAIAKDAPVDGVAAAKQVQDLSSGRHVPDADVDDIDIHNVRTPEVINSQTSPRYDSEMDLPSRPAPAPEPAASPEPDFGFDLLERPPRPATVAEPVEAPRTEFDFDIDLPEREVLEVLDELTRAVDNIVEPVPDVKPKDLTNLQRRLYDDRAIDYINELAGGGGGLAPLIQKAIASAASGEGWTNTRLVENALELISRLIEDRKIIRRALSRPSSYVRAAAQSNGTLPLNILELAKRGIRDEVTQLNRLAKVLDDAKAVDVPGGAPAASARQTLRDLESLGVENPNAGAPLDNYLRQLETTPGGVVRASTSQRGSLPTSMLDAVDEKPLADAFGLRLTVSDDTAREAIYELSSYGDSMRAFGLSDANRTFSDARGVKLRPLRKGLTRASVMEGIKETLEFIARELNPNVIRNELAMQRAIITNAMLNNPTLDMVQQLGIVQRDMDAVDELIFVMDGLYDLYRKQDPNVHRIVPDIFDYSQRLKSGTRSPLEVPFEARMAPDIDLSDSVGVVASAVKNGEALPIDPSAVFVGENTDKLTDAMAAANRAFSGTELGMTDKQTGKLNQVAQRLGVPTGGSVAEVLSNVRSKAGETLERLRSVDQFDAESFKSITKSELIDMAKLYAVPGYTRRILDPTTGKYYKVSDRKLELFEHIKGWFEDFVNPDISIRYMHRGTGAAMPEVVVTNVDPADVSGMVAELEHLRANAAELYAAGYNNAGDIVSKRAALIQEALDRPKFSMPGPGGQYTADYGNEQYISKLNIASDDPEFVKIIEDSLRRVHPSLLDEVPLDKVVISDVDSIVNRVRGVLNESDFKEIESTLNDAVARGYAMNFTMADGTSFIVIPKSYLSYADRALSHELWHARTGVVGYTSGGMSYTDETIPYVLSLMGKAKEYPYYNEVSSVGTVSKLTQNEFKGKASKAVLDDYFKNADTHIIAKARAAIAAGAETNYAMWLAAVSWYEEFHSQSSKLNRQFLGVLKDFQKGMALSEGQSIGNSGFFDELAAYDITWRGDVVDDIINKRFDQIRVPSIDEVTASASKAVDGQPDSGLGQPVESFEQGVQGQISNWRGFRQGDDVGSRVSGGSSKAKGLDELGKANEYGPGLYGTSNETTARWYAQSHNRPVPGVEYGLPSVDTYQISPTANVKLFDEVSTDYFRLHNAGRYDEMAAINARALDDGVDVIASGTGDFVVLNPEVIVGQTRKPVPDLQSPLQRAAAEYSARTASGLPTGQARMSLSRQIMRETGVAIDRALDDVVTKTASDAVNYYDSLAVEVDNIGKQLRTTVDDYPKMIRDSLLDVERCL